MSENKMKVQLTLLSTTWSLNLINHQIIYKNLQWFMFLKSYLFSFFVISSYYKFSKAVYLWSRSCCRLRRKSGKVQMVDEAKIDMIMMLIKSYSVKKRKWKVLFAPDKIDVVSDIMCNQAGELTPTKKNGVNLIVCEYAQCRQWNKGI